MPVGGADSVFEGSSQWGQAHGAVVGGLDRHARFAGQRVDDQLLAPRIDGAQPRGSMNFGDSNATCSGRR